MQRTTTVIIRTLAAAMFLVCASGCSRSAPKPTTSTSPLASDKLAPGAVNLIGGDYAHVSNGPPGAPADSARVFGPTTVTPGNTITVKSDIDTKVSSVTQVPWDGVVHLPYEVSVKVGGLPLEEARDKIAESYKEIFRSSSHIIIKLDNQKVLVRARGLVAKPGEYLLARGASLDELVAAAGGLVRAADGAGLPTVATIASNGMRTGARLDDYYGGYSENLPGLQGGEIVLFHDGAAAEANDLGVAPGRVRFLGQIKRPGEILVKDSAHLMYYLVQAGGPTDTANLNRINVWRISEGEVYSFPIEIHDEEPVKLVSGDLVFVPGDPRNTIERAAPILGAFGSMVGSMAAVAIASGAN